MPVYFCEDCNARITANPFVQTHGDEVSLYCSQLCVIRDDMKRIESMKAQTSLYPTSWNGA
jgi:hypothetical protein